MESQNCLGIYVSKDSATVVCLGPQGRGAGLLDCFSVSLEKSEEQGAGADVAELARLVAEGCDERGLGFSEAAVALDCAMFMQHQVHSEFRETKQIAQTVRFDVEEALSTDVSDVAVAFKRISSDDTGSELAVFTVRREKMSEILLALQENDIDPVTVEPDVDCLSRFISENVSLSENSHSLFALLSQRNGYFVAFPDSQEAPAVRTFLVGRTSDRNQLLLRQVPIGVSTAASEAPIDSLRVFDSTGSVNGQQLSQRLGLRVDGVNLAGSVVAEPGEMADCVDTVDFAIAYGAALGGVEKAQIANFRDDFMPYQGKKLRLQKTLKFLSVSITVLMVALGVYLTSQLLRKNSYLSRLRGKFAPQYSAVMSGRKPPAGLKGAVQKLDSVKRRLEHSKNPLADEGVLGQITLLLEAFNDCAQRTKLGIDSISITDKSIVISGTTSNRRNTLKLRDAIKRSGLGDLYENIKPAKGRSGFRITIEPKKPGRGKA